MNADAKLEEMATPEGLDLTEVERGLAVVRANMELRNRIEQISERFLGRPYVEGPLGGGEGLPEVFRISLDAFDCVTFIETVLALALSSTVNEFIETIRQVRYENGEIDWAHRNHYMIDWARRNEARGFIANIAAGADTVEKTCQLDEIPGLPTKRVTFHYFPKRSLPRIEAIAQTGDLILFVSAKDTLDVFHTGLLVERSGRMLLRHATRAAGAVIEQPLIEFVNINELAGFILLRPLCRR